MKTYKGLTWLALMVMVVFAASNAFGISLKVGSNQCPKEDQCVVEITAEDAVDLNKIAGAAFTLEYSSQIEMTGLMSDFFDTFANQFAGTPAAEQTSVEVDGITYYEPVVSNPVVQKLRSEVPSTTLLAAARCKATENAIQAGKVLFRVGFNCKEGCEVNTPYEIRIKPTILNNTDAGYSAEGEPIDLLVGIADDPNIPYTSSEAYPVLISKTDYETKVISGNVTYIGGCEADIDEDGLCDEWEILHFGDLTTANSTTDNDRDGYPDVVEQEFEKDPKVQDDPDQPGYDPTTDDRNTEFWIATLKVQGDDLGGVSEASVKIGVSPTPANEEAPPLPPQYSVDMKIWPEDFSKGYATDLRSSGEDSYAWIISINPHGNLGSPTERSATLKWEHLNTIGTYTLREGFDGSGAIVVPDMSAVSEFTVTGVNSDQYFRIEFGHNVSFDMVLKKGWNLISLPLVPVDGTLSVLFPDATIAYKFQNSYQKAETLEPGLGYWVKMEEAKTYTIMGQPFVSYQKDLGTGWHLLGAVNMNSVVPVTSPDGSVSIMYGFDTSYSKATELNAGKGYWVKIETQCSFNMNMPQ